MKSGNGNKAGVKVMRRMPAVIDMDAPFSKGSFKQSAKGGRLVFGQPSVASDVAKVCGGAAVSGPHHTSDPHANEVKISRILESARNHIEHGKLAFRGAADQMSAAQDHGATQRRIAEAVGMSVGWVNALLQWRQMGYPDAGPFPKRRSIKPVQSAEQVSDSVIDNGDAALIGTPASFSVEQRSGLIEFLELLATAKPALRAKFAACVEKRRAEIGLTWSDLLIPAQDTDPHLNSDRS